MTDDNKQPVESNIIKTGFLIIATISFVIPIIYFTLTAPPISVLESINKTSLHRENIGEFYQWNILLQLVAVIALLLLLYFTVTINISKIYHKLITGFSAFKSQIVLSEVIIKCVIILFTLAALSAIIMMLYYDCCDWWIIVSGRLSSPAELLNFRNILIGIVGIATLIFTGWRTYIADQQKESQVKQTKIAEGRRLGERFDNAVEALSKNLDESSFPAHLGAISGLRSLATDSAVNTQRCLDIICSCNQWMEGYLDEFAKERRKFPYSHLLLNEHNRIAKNNKIGHVTLLHEKCSQESLTSTLNKGEKITLLHEKRSQEALVAISHILKKISTNDPKKLKKLKFHNKMLCGISLSNLKLDGIDFQNTYLVAADMYNVSLNKAKLNLANLQKTYLEKASLRGASLRRANLKISDLWDANLQGAFLWKAKLQGASLSRANLQGSFLNNSNLQNAYLGGANLQGTFLKNIDLEGALLINTMLQGAFLNNSNLSNTMVLGCNLYGTKLNNVKSKNIIFNDISDAGHIKDNDRREKYLDSICQDMKLRLTRFFKHRMKAAWYAMDHHKKPNGLDIIKGNSITLEYKDGTYYISEDDLVILKGRLQKMVNERGIGFLYDMKNSLLLLNNQPKGEIGLTMELFKGHALTYKSFSLINKLQKIADKLIESNKKENNKKPHNLEW